MTGVIMKGYNDFT